MPARARLKGVAAIAKRHKRTTGSSSFLSLAKLAPLVSGIPCLQFPGVNQPSQAATGWDRRAPIYDGNATASRTRRDGRKGIATYSLYIPLNKFPTAKTRYARSGPDASPSVTRPSLSLPLPLLFVAPLISRVFETRENLPL